jgi:hypothetical protein
MKKIYHHYNIWECFKNKMYLTKDLNETENIKKVIDFFTDENIFIEVGHEMIREWKFTLQHHLSDESINKIAYIGQLACNYKHNIPEITTKKAWYMLDEETRIKSNNNARLIIQNYFKNETKNRQLYLFME